MTVNATAKASETTAAAFTTIRNNVLNFGVTGKLKKDSI
jgi:hypothetical protein